MLSVTVENYLKALFTLANELREISISDLSTHLNVSKPSVNSMVKTLNQEGWIVYEKYKPLKLTEKGRRAGAFIIRRHRLTEMFLVEKMGFGWEEVHEIAEQIEHIKAPSFFDRMDRLLDFPTVDPHGSPIPDKNGNVVSQNFKRLSDCKPGEKVRLLALSNSSKEFLEFLDSREISLKSVFEIHEIEPFDKSMLLSYGQKNRESFSQKVCERLMVEPVV